MALLLRCRRRRKSARRAESDQRCVRRSVVRLEFVRRSKLVDEEQANKAP